MKIKIPIFCMLSFNIQDPSFRVRKHGLCGVKIQIQVVMRKYFKTTIPSIWFVPLIQSVCLLLYTSERRGRHIIRMTNFFLNEGRVYNRHQRNLDMRCLGGALINTCLYFYLLFPFVSEQLFDLFVDLFHFCRLLRDFKI